MFESVYLILQIPSSLCGTVFPNFLTFIFSITPLTADVCVPPSDGNWSCLLFGEVKTFAPTVQGKGGRQSGLGAQKILEGALEQG